MRERFNTVAVAIPAQQFLVRCHVSVERQVPVMTEFAVRLLHLAGSMEVEALRAYFGLRAKELTDLLDLLRGEGLIEEAEGRLNLTSYAQARFVGSNDGLPRFTRIAERQSRPVFELLSFSPISRALSSNYWDNTLDLDWDALGENSGRTVDQAQEAFHRHFHEIERQDNEDERRRAFDVYKIDGITAGRRFNVPLPVHFEVDLDGNVDYDLEEQLELLPDELRSIVYKLTADRVAREPQHSDHFGAFVQVFGDEVLARYFRERNQRADEMIGVTRNGKVVPPTPLAPRFDFASYVREVHGSADGQIYDSGRSRALLGALYLPKNQDRFVDAFAAALRRFKISSSVETIYPTEMFWVLPDSDLWGRTELVRRFAERIARTVAKEWGEPVDLVAVCSSAQAEPNERTRRKAHLLLEAGFSDVLFGPTLASSERFEVLVLPGVHAVAMYQWKVPTSDVVSVPLGFSTVDAKKVRKLVVYLQRVCSAKIYRVFRGSDEVGEDRKLKVTDATAADFVYLNHFLDGSEVSSPS